MCYCFYRRNYDKDLGKNPPLAVHNTLRIPQTPVSSEVIEISPTSRRRLRSKASSPSDRITVVAVRVFRELRVYGFGVYGLGGLGEGSPDSMTHDLCPGLL